MSAHMKMHPTEEMFEISIKRPGSKKHLYYLSSKYMRNFEDLLHKYAKSELVDWTEVTKESIAKHKQAGMVLRGARFRENLSQKELAKRSGVSQDNISRIENGKRGVGEKVAKKLAKALKINYNLLLEKDENQ